MLCSGGDDDLKWVVGEPLLQTVQEARRRVEGDDDDGDIILWSEGWFFRERCGTVVTEVLSSDVCVVQAPEEEASEDGDGAHGVLMVCQCYGVR